MDLSDLSAWGLNLDHAQLYPEIWDEISLAAPQSWKELSSISGALKERLDYFRTQAGLVAALPAASKSDTATLNGRTVHLIASDYIEHLRHVALDIALYVGAEMKDKSSFAKFLTNFFNGMEEDAKEAKQVVRNALWTWNENQVCANYIYLGSKAANLESERANDTFAGTENLRLRVWSALYVGVLIQNMIEVARVQNLGGATHISERDNQLIKGIAHDDSGIVTERLLTGTKGIIEAFGLATRYFVPKPETIADVVEGELHFLNANARQNIFEAMRISSLPSETL